MTDRKAYYKEYNSRPERVSAKKKWFDENRTRINALRRNRAKENNEKYREYWRNYNKLHPGRGNKYKRTERSKELFRKWCEANREKRRLASARSYAKHHERRKNELRLWRINNPERHRAIQKKYQLKHREEISERLKKYYRKRYASDPDFRLQYSLRAASRRALKSNSTVSPESIKIFVSRVKSKKTIKCYYCEKTVSTKRINFDHIIPLSKGGPHSIENLCVSCEFCNKSKHNKTLREFLRLGQQLLELNHA